MIQSLEEEGSCLLPQVSCFLPQVLIVLERVKISGMGYASDVCLVGKRSTFSKYTQSALRDYTDPTKCALENDLAEHQFFSRVATSASQRATREKN